MWDGSPKDLMNGRTIRVVDLSLGQQQLLAWARVLLRRPRVLLVDEATNALAPELEGCLLTRLAEELSDVAILWAAHQHSQRGFFH